MMKFVEWVKEQDELDVLELVDSVNSFIFEGEVWERLDWLEIQYDRDEVRAWALSYGDDDDEEA